MDRTRFFRVTGGARSPHPVREARVRDERASIFSQQTIGADYVYTHPAKSVKKEAEPFVKILASGWRRVGSSALFPWTRNASAVFRDLNFCTLLLSLLRTLLCTPLDCAVTSFQVV